MMTLEEAIKHCEEVAEELGMKADFETDNQTYAMSESERTEFKECAKDHRQLAEWLKELKKRREQDVPDTNVGDTISRQAAFKDAEPEVRPINYRGDDEYCPHCGARIEGDE